MHVETTSRSVRRPRVSGGWGSCINERDGSRLVCYIGRLDGNARIEIVVGGLPQEAGLTACGVVYGAAGEESFGFLWSSY